MRRLDPQSLGEHLDPMYRAAWALCGSREDAEDLVQDTITRVLSRPRLVRGDERGYLLQALRNTFNSRLRTRSRRPRTIAFGDDGEPVDGGARVDHGRGTEPERHAETAEVLRAISELPEDFRLAIVAVDIVGLSYGEAAKALGTKEATITTRLYRARRRIAERFADTEPDPPGRNDPRPGSMEMESQ